MKRRALVILVATLTACQSDSPPQSRLQMVNQPMTLKAASDLTSDAQGLSFKHLASVSVPSGLQATDFAQFGDYLAVTYMSAGEVLAGGVDIIDFSVETNPRLVASWTTTAAEYARILMVTDHLAYVVGAFAEGALLTVLDLSNPAAPQVVGGLAFDGWFAVTVERTADPNVVWVVVGDDLGVVEVDVSDPRTPVVARTHLLPNAVSVAPPFVLGGAAETAVYRIEEGQLTKVATLSDEPVLAPADIVIDGDRIISNADHTGLSVLSLKDGSVQHHEALPGTGNGLSLAGGYGLLAQGEAGTRLHGMCSSGPVYVGSFDVLDDAGSANRVSHARFKKKHFLMLADGASGFRIVGVDLDNQLKASKEHDPSRWQDARIVLFEPWTIEVPAKLPVVNGNAGNHTATLYFDDVVCTYQGGSDQAHPQENDQVNKGKNYELVSCSNGAQVGDAITAACEVVLHIDNGDSNFSPTTVHLPLAILNSDKP